MIKRMIALITVFILLCGATPVNAFALLDGFTSERSYMGQFIDVPDSAWYAPSVKLAYESGLINGVSQTKFSPNSNITYGQTLALAARIHAKYYGNTIPTSVGSWWLDPYIDYILDNDILNEDVMFGLPFNDEINRLSFIVLMSITLPVEEYEILNEAVLEQSIPDLPLETDIASWIYLMYAAGILTGNDQYGTFEPYSSITRAEVSTIVTRMIDPSQRKTFTLQEKPAVQEKPHVKLNNFIGSYFTSAGDENRPWLGYHLTISSITDTEVGFYFNYEKSGHAIGFKAEPAQFVSETKAIAYGTEFYGDEPENTHPVKYEMTFSNNNIHLDVYIDLGDGESSTPSYSIDFACSGTIS